MNKLLYFFISILCIVSCKNDDSTPEEIALNFQGTTRSITSIGGSKNESFQSVCASLDGGYVVAGFVQSNDGDIEGKVGDDFDFWVQKYNEEDTLEWEKFYGGTDVDKGYAIEATMDGGYILVGQSKSTDGDVPFNAGFDDIIIIKLDGQGNKQWGKNHGFFGSDKGYTVKQTLDGGYIIGGVLDVTASNGLGNDRSAQTSHAGGDYWLIKLSANGDKEWRQYYGGSFTDTLNDIEVLEDGGYLLVGSSDSEDVDISNNKGTYDIWVLKVASDSSLEWNKNYGGTQIESAYGIAKTREGNYVIVGDTRSNDVDISELNGNADMWMITINSNGTLLSEHTFGGVSFDTARSITPSATGSLFIVGSSRSLDGDVSSNQGQNDLWMLEVDSNGAILWEHTIGGTQVDVAYDVAQLTNNSIVVVGDTASNDGDFTTNKGFTDACIIRID